MPRYALTHTQHKEKREIREIYTCSLAALRVNEIPHQKKKQRATK